MTEEFKQYIQEFIDKCDMTLVTRNVNQAEGLQEQIINAFSSFIPDIDNFLDSWYFNRSEQIDYLGNIKKLKDKLKILLITDGTYSLVDKHNVDKVVVQNHNTIADSGNSINTNTNNNTNTVNPTFDIKVALDKARKEIEENEYLDDDAKEEINDQLDQIESVMGEEESNNDKWKKLKSVVNWVSNKGYKIGQLVMPLITKALFPDAE